MYIVLEGIDGAGKSTQIKLLKEWLENNGLKVETVVEPTDFEVGKLIRELLTRSDATSDTMQKTLGLLFAADRLILMDKIEKLESENTVVISDRSFYSSLVYQKPQEWIKELNKYAKIPDLVLLLDLDVKKSVERCDGTDEFENEEFLIKYCQGIQMASPIDSNSIPIPWDMPGYTDQVIMAAGAFVQGSSIELSADGPIREPYIVYQQGSLTYAYGKIAINKALNSLINENIT